MIPMQAHSAFISTTGSSQHRPFDASLATTILHATTNRTVRTQSLDGHNRNGGRNAMVLAIGFSVW